MGGIKCPACSSNKIVATKDYCEVKKGKEFQIFRCEKCKARFTIDD